MTRDEIADRMREYRSRPWRGGDRTGGGVRITYRGPRAVADRRVIPAPFSLRPLPANDPLAKAGLLPAGTDVFDAYDLDEGADVVLSCAGVESWSIITPEEAPDGPQAGGR